MANIAMLPHAPLLSVTAAWSLSLLIAAPSATTTVVAFLAPRTLPFPPTTGHFLYQENDYGNGNGETPTTLMNGEGSVSGIVIANELLNNNDESETDIVGAGTLGDIMAGSKEDILTKHQHDHNHGHNSTTTSSSSSTALIDGLVTKEGGELNARFFPCDFTPMERIALTANGNLQRIFSSYYDAPVHVHVDSCSRRRDSSRNDLIPGSSSRNNDKNNNNNQNNSDNNNDNEDAIWDRVVHIQVHNQTICKATSIVSVQSSECIQLIEDGSVGLGQMFRYLDKLPTFSLLDAGRAEEQIVVVLEDEEEEGSSEEGEEEGSCSSDDDVCDDSGFGGGMWRTYELHCEEMTCLIHEEFCRDAWNII